ncbi:hypothetical protein HK096_006854 [Nowakowskiella sp. JEL0078]|nr:hypothetical protein HK096_006854 [Nowakowskiella sp. JEL0078]
MAILAKKGIEPPIWRKSGILFGAMTALYFLMVGLFLGQSFQPAKYQSNLNIIVVDFDADLLGKKFSDVTAKALASGTGPGWLAMASVQYPSGPDGVLSKVANGEAWGAIVVNPGSTKRLQDAINNPSSVYSPQEAITFYYDAGRSPQTILQDVVMPMRQLAQNVSTQFGPEFLKNLNFTVLSKVLDQNPSLISNPISYTEVNIHPNNAPVVDGSLGFGQVFLIVFCFAITLAIHQMTGPLVLNLELSTLLSLRMRIISIFCIGISLWYTILHSALGVPFTPGNWFAFWFLNALQMFVHVFILLNFGLLVGRNSPIFPLIFLIILILNATAGLGVIELSSEFYRWGYAMPMWNAVTACRTLIFGSYNRLSLNVGILFAWFIVSLFAYIWIQLSGREFDDEDDTDSYFAPGRPDDVNVDRKWIENGEDRAVGGRHMEDLEDPLEN